MTASYNNVLYYLGIDVILVIELCTLPKTVYNVSKVKLDTTLAYLHLQSKKKPTGLI